MRRSRKRRQTAEVSLFPFLAVLICTLGVLIVLLVLAVKAADVEAREVRESQEDEIDAQIAKLDLQLSTNLIRIEGLSQVRPEVVTRLTNVRTYRGHLEDEIRRLAAEAKGLAQQLSQLDETAAESDVPATDEEIDALKNKIMQARDNLAEIRKQSRVQLPVTYSIMPQTTPGGTFRRPIYIECKGGELILQPHDITLRPSDFTEPFAPGNPLDAALLAIREYWTKYDLAGDQGHPYPLMVIRPSGAQSYAVARRAMKSWDSEFGYEVIEADKQLEFGEHDPQLKKIIETAVENAKRQQAYVAAVRRRLSRARGNMSGSENYGPGLVASGPNGGFVSAGGYRGGSGNRGGGSHRDGSSQNHRAPLAANQVSSRGTAKQTAPFGSVLDQYRGGSENSAGGSGNESKSSATKPSSVKSESSETEGQLANAGKSKNGAESTSSGSQSVESLAKERGQDWALPTRTPGATGYLRPIRIYCGSDQLQIQRNQFDRVTIPFDGQTENAVAPMVDAIWQIIDRWGVAGANGYWKPQLRFTIENGGQMRFDELKLLLDQSGLEIKGNSQ